VHSGQPDLAPVLPVMSRVESPFWTALRDRRLLLQHCSRCSSLIFPVASVCPTCLAQESRWIEASGRAILVSWVVVHQATHPAFTQRTPYNVAWVELAEGPRLISAVVGASGATLHAGLALTADFEPLTAEISLLMFRVAL